MTPWTDVEIRRFQARAGMFARRGMSADVAEQFAEKCLERDRDGDDRRACVECKHRQADGRCLATRKPAMPLMIFQRCERFEWMVPKTGAAA